MTTTPTIDSYTVNALRGRLPWHTYSDRAVIAGIAPDHGMPYDPSSKSKFVVPDTIAAWMDPTSSRIWVRQHAVAGMDEKALTRWLDHAGAKYNPNVASLSGLGVISHEEAHAVWTPPALRSATGLMLEDLRIESLAMETNAIIARPILRACAVTNVFDPEVGISTGNGIGAIVGGYLLVGGRVRIGVLSDGSEWWLDRSHSEGTAVSDMMDAFADILGEDALARLDSIIDRYIETDGTYCWTAGNAGSYHWTTPSGQQRLANTLAERDALANEVDALIRELGGAPEQVRDRTHCKWPVKGGTPTPGGEAPEDDEDEAASMPGTGGQADREENGGMGGKSDSDAAESGDDSGAGGTGGESGESGDEPGNDAQSGADGAGQPGSDPVPTAPGGEAPEGSEDSSGGAVEGGETVTASTEGNPDKLGREDEHAAGDMIDRGIDPEALERLTEAARELADAVETDVHHTAARAEKMVAGDVDAELLDPQATAKTVFGASGKRTRTKILDAFGHAKGLDAANATAEARAIIEEEGRFNEDIEFSGEWMDDIDPRDL